PLGTITRSILDGQGDLLRVWVGTNDNTISGTNITDFNETNQGNMTLVAQNYYDTYDPQTVGLGDGNLTRSVQYTNGTAAATLHVSENFFDWRNRMVATKDGVLLDTND